MAKQIMNESQIVDLVKTATMEAINKILSEDSATLRATADAFKSELGDDKPMSDDDFKRAKGNFIKYGKNPNWNNFIKKR